MTIADYIRLQSIIKEEGNIEKGSIIYSES